MLSVWSYENNFLVVTDNIHNTHPSSVILQKCCNRSVGKKFDMGKSSLFVSFYRVILALNKLAGAVIRWPDAARRAENERLFRRLAGVRGAIGAIDGSYVPIKAPTKNSHVYINRKCFFGITLQAVADPELRFINCFAGYPSSVGDARIFRNSPIYREMETRYDEYFDMQQFIIGDKAYPCKKFCLPPYIERYNITPRERNFNTLQARTRQVIERAFALLFGRFRRLRYLDMSRTDLIPYTVIAVCVLHNLCIAKDEELEVYITEGMAFFQEMNNGNINAQFVAAAEGAVEAAPVLMNVPNAHEDDEIGVQLRELLCTELNVP